MTASSFRLIDLRIKGIFTNVRESNLPEYFLLGIEVYLQFELKMTKTLLKLQSILKM